MGKPLSQKTLFNGALAVAATFGCSNGNTLPIGITSTDSTFTRPTATPSGGTTSGGSVTSYRPTMTPVTFIVPAEDWLLDNGNRIPTASASDLANTENGPTNAHTTSGLTYVLGQTHPSGSVPNVFQVPFKFAFSYPQNNFQLLDARLIVDTLRDNTGTEAIMVDGIMSGRPLTETLNTFSKYFDATGHVYCAVPSLDTATCGAEKNTYFIKESLKKYRKDVFNTFDFSLSSLISGSGKTSYDILNDGSLKAFMMDDSLVKKAFLLVKGSTISNDPLQCTNSPQHDFGSSYLHNDGPSGTTHPLQGDACTVSQSSNSASNSQCDFFEFHYVPALPSVGSENIDITKAQIPIQLRRGTTSSTAVLVVNGVAVAQPGFNRSTVTSDVKEWLDDSTTLMKWNLFASTIATDLDVSNYDTQTAKTLDLLDIFGPAKLRQILAEGALNIAMGGGIWAGSNGEGAVSVRIEATTNREATLNSGTYGQADIISKMDIGGATLRLEGTFSAQNCVVPDDPSSPLKESGLPDVVVDNGLPPVVTSSLVDETLITSTSAQIVWTTDVPTTGVVNFGVGSTSERQSGDGTKFSKSHVVELAGLIPYTFYKFQMHSANQFGNSTTTNVATLKTKR